ncbi:MAG: TIGR03118 family protein [Actinomycetota bacterium]
MSRFFVLALAAAAAVLMTAVPLQAAGSNAYTVTPLVSDQATLAGPPDATLVNAWGLVAGLTANGSTPWWVVDNGANASTLYTNTGAKQALTVGVAGNPTGIVFNAAGAGFQVAGAASLFIFDNESGQILAWRGGLAAAQVVHDSSPDSAVYKGLAFATTSNGPRVYATDFHNGRVDVFDSSWTKIVQPGGFADTGLPDGYAPFGIQSAGGRIFVTYAKQDSSGHDEIAGQGRGLVDVYDTSGALLARVAQHGQLNAPWGIAVAPASFGRFGGDVLIGNFGDGQINAYEELSNGQFAHRGELRSSDDGIVTIDGLWALEFGLGGRSGPTDTLFFTAGPDDEGHGLFGSITAG